MPSPIYYIVRVPSPPPPAIQKPDKPDYLGDYNSTSKRILHTREPSNAMRFSSAVQATQFCLDNSIKVLGIEPFDKDSYFARM